MLIGVYDRAFLAFMQILRKLINKNFFKIGVFL